MCLVLSWQGIRMDYLSHVKGLSIMCKGIIYHVQRDYLPRKKIICQSVMRKGIIYHV